MTWDTDLAKLAKPITAPTQAEGTPELVWVRDNADKHDFARSLKSYFDRTGTLTPGQVAAVTRILTANAQAAVFAQTHAREIAWIQKNAADNSFAASLRESLARFGTLTERQIEAVRRSLTSEARVFAQVPDLDISCLPEGRYAVPDGATRLKIRIHRQTQGKYAGWIFVTDAAAYGQQTRYGAQPKGEHYRGKVADALAAILRNPIEALKAYGHLTGTCGVCGRALEDEESVARGIGPICASRL